MELQLFYLPYELIKLFFFVKFLLCSSLLPNFASYLSLFYLIKHPLLVYSVIRFVFLLLFDSFIDYLC